MCFLSHTGAASNIKTTLRNRPFGAKKVHWKIVSDKSKKKIEAGNQLER